MLSNLLCDEEPAALCWPCPSLSLTHSVVCICVLVVHCNRCLPLTCSLAVCLA
jgi:hypothetical protein